MSTPMIPSKTEFGAWLRKQRLALNYTLLQMGSRLTISSGGLSHMERGEWGATKEQIERMATYFGVDVSEIKSLKGYDVVPDYKATVYEYRKSRKRKSEPVRKHSDLISIGDLRLMEPEKLAVAVNSIIEGKVRCVG